MGEDDLEAGLVKCPGCSATWHWVMGDAPSMVCPACGREIPRPAGGDAEDGMGFGSWLDGIEQPAPSAAPAREVSVEEAMQVLKGQTSPSPEAVEEKPAEVEPEPPPKKEPPVEAKKEAPVRAKKEAAVEAKEREPASPKPVPLPQGALRPQPSSRRRPVQRPAPPQPPQAADVAQKPPIRKLRVWTAGAKALVFLLLLCVLGAGGGAGYLYWMWVGMRESRDAERRATSAAQSQAGKLKRDLKEANQRASGLSAEAEELKKKLARATDDARKALGKEFEDTKAGLAEKTEALASLEKQAGQTREKLAGTERELRALRGKNEALRKTARKELEARKRSEDRLARIERATADLPSDLGEVELRYVAARQIAKVKEMTARLESVARAGKRAQALAQLTRGLELLVSLDAAGARRSFEEATKADPSWPEANLYLGFALYRLGEDGAAAKAFERASELGPRARFHLGDVRFSAGDERGAIEAWEQGTKGEGPFAELCSSKLALFKSDAYGAVDGSRSAMREEPSWEARVALARALLALGGEKNMAEAVKELSAAAAMQRWDPRPFVALGELRLEQKNARLAASAGNWAVRLRPSSAEARVLLSRVFLLRGSKQAALGELDKAIKLRPKFAPARLERGRLLASSGKPAAALGDIDAALRSSPGNAAVHVLRGELLSTAGKHAEALDAYRRACSLDREDVGAASRLVGLLLKEGTPVRNVPGATLKARELVQMTSRTNPEALTLLAGALFASGDAAGAARVQREAFTISSRPEHLDAMKRYEKAAREK